MLTKKDLQSVIKEEVQSSEARITKRIVEEIQFSEKKMAKKMEQEISLSEDRVKSELQTEIRVSEKRIIKEISSFVDDQLLPQFDDKAEKDEVDLIKSRVTKIESQLHL